MLLFLKLLHQNNGFVCLFFNLGSIWTLLRFPLHFFLSFSPGLLFKLDRSANVSVLVKIISFFPSIF